MEPFISGLGCDRNVDFWVKIDLLNFVSPTVLRTYSEINLDLIYLCK